MGVRCILMNIELAFVFKFCSVAVACFRYFFHQKIQFVIEMLHNSVDIQILIKYQAAEL